MKSCILHPRLVRLAALAASIALSGACSSSSSRCDDPAACEADGSGSDTEADAGGDPTDDAEPDVDDGLPDPVCRAGTFWEYGTRAFREATTEWGLEGVEGSAISVGDIDGDGYVDVFVRGPGAGTNDWDPEFGQRTNWLLLNTGTGFLDITAESGVDDPRRQRDTRSRPYGVVAFADVDNDGDLDVYTGADTYDTMVARNETSEIMLNSGDGFFSFTSLDNGVRRVDDVDVPASAAFVDVDRDGRIDLWVPQREYSLPDGPLTFLQDRFYHGSGDGLFTDGTEDAGLLTEPWGEVSVINEARAHTRAWSATACDLNDDGVPELMAASYGRAPNHLWQGAEGPDGAVTYTNRSVASGYAYDDDTSWDDNQFARCFCMDNRDAEGCADLPNPVTRCSPNWRHDLDREPFRLGGNSSATLCADLDNDGDLDLLTTELKHWWAGDGADVSSILLNTGETDVRFDRSVARELYGFVVRHVSGPDWDEGHLTATILDFDNDGWADFYIGGSEYAGNFGLLYHQQQPSFWEEVPVEDGFEHNRSLGVAAADFDRDGDLDLLVGHSRARCDDDLPNDCYPTEQVRLFENVLGDQGNWVQLQLEGGPHTNRSAIGARVEVTADGVTQTQEVGGGYGHSGQQNDLVLHFGLGAACEAQVTVRWPDADLTEQTFRVVSGYRFHVVQGSGPVVVD